MNRASFFEDPLSIQRHKFIRHTESYMRPKCGGHDHHSSFSVGLRNCRLRGSMLPILWHVPMHEWRVDTAHAHIHTLVSAAQAKASLLRSLHV